MPAVHRVGSTESAARLVAAAQATSVAACQSSTSLALAAVTACRPYTESSAQVRWRRRTPVEVHRLSTSLAPAAVAACRPSTESRAWLAAAAHDTPVAAHMLSINICRVRRRTQRRLAQLRCAIAVSTKSVKRTISRSRDSRINFLRKDLGPDETIDTYEEYEMASLIQDFFGILYSAVDDHAPSWVFQILLMLISSRYQKLIAF